jgi:hypothetical protein
MPPGASGGLRSTASGAKPDRATAAGGLTSGDLARHTLQVAARPTPPSEKAKYHKHLTRCFHRPSSSPLTAASLSTEFPSSVRAACTSKGGFLSIAPQELLPPRSALHLLALSRHRDRTYQRRLLPARGLGPDGVEHQGKQERKARPHERTSRGNKHALQQVIRYLMQRTSFFLTPSGATLTCYRNKRKKGALGTASPSIRTRNQGGTHG